MYHIDHCRIFSQKNLRHSLTPLHQLYSVDFLMGILAWAWGLPGAHGASVLYLQATELDKCLKNQKGACPYFEIFTDSITKDST